MSSNDVNVIEARVEGLKKLIMETIIQLGKPKTLEVKAGFNYVEGTSHEACVPFVNIKFEAL